MSAGLGTRIVMRRGRYLPCSFRLAALLDQGDAGVLLVCLEAEAGLD